jgi:hypothetical protein
MCEMAKCRNYRNGRVYGTKGIHIHIKKDSYFVSHLLPIGKKQLISPKGVTPSVPLGKIMSFFFLSIFIIPGHVRHRLNIHILTYDNR